MGSEMCIRDSVFLNRDIAVKTKIAVYNAVCVSTLLYGCEAWTVYRRHVKMLEKFHISCLQRILWLHWCDKIPHTEIRQRANCLSIEATLASRLLRWTGHVIRMPTNRLPRRVLYGDLAEGRRSISGQYKRCKDVVKNTMRKCEQDPAQQLLWTAISDATHARPVPPTYRRSWIGQLHERRPRRHAAALTAAAPDPALLCPTCGRQCRSRIGLFSHQRTHPNT